MAVHTIYKKKYETPLEALENLRRDMQISTDTPMTYAGRLDPLAEGLLLILSGDDVHRKDEYLLLSKTYEAQIVLGISTDTYDIFGIPNVVEEKKISEAEIKEAFQSFIGERTYLYPPYSSKTVQGLPLFTYAKSGTLNTISIPTYTGTIFDLDIKNISEVSPSDLFEEVSSACKNISGDFRQEDIQHAWKKIKDTKAQTFIVVSVTLSVSGGMYIRTLAHEVGDFLGVGGSLLSLVRTRLGNMIFESENKLN